MSANLRKVLCGTALLGAMLVSPAIADPSDFSSDGMSDKEVYAAMIGKSYKVCLDEVYSGAKAAPVIEKIPVETIRILFNDNVLLCPNTKLTTSGGPAVVWYSNQKTMAWNPDTAGAADILATQLIAMAHANSYPSEIKTWGIDGKPIDHQTVPRQDFDCLSSRSWDCQNR